MSRTYVVWFRELPDMADLDGFMKSLDFKVTENDSVLRQYDYCGSETKWGMDLLIYDPREDVCVLGDAPEDVKAVAYGDLSIGLGVSDYSLNDPRREEIIEEIVREKGYVPEYEYHKRLDPGHFAHYKTALELSQRYNVAVIVDQDTDARIDPTRNVLPNRK